MNFRTVGLSLLLVASACSAADDPAASALHARFRDAVQPFLQTYCITCHGAAKPKGDFDLSPFSTVESVAKDFKRWELVLDKLQAEEMPPEKAKQHPRSELRREMIEWILALRKSEAKRTAGDPGPVFARRLSNAEYDNTIRDLTGVDMRPAHEFPIDPANAAGFDNSSESLSMSPALVKKYLDAARLVADHLILTPDGLAFAPSPAATDTDRDKYCVNRIMEFYTRQHTDLADYFRAAWRFKNRAALGKPDATLADFAGEMKLSAKYLAAICRTLNETKEESGPLAALQAMWRDLNSADQETSQDLKRSRCQDMRDFVVMLRERLAPEVNNIGIKGENPSGQPLVLWKDRQWAANRMRYKGGALKLKNPGLAPHSAADEAMRIPPNANEIAPLTDAERQARRDAIANYEAAFQRFCAIFPDAFIVTERARVWVDSASERQLAKGRLLSAGFHLMEGYFRDDGPLCELMLDAPARRELDELWRELDFIANAPLRQYASFIWFEHTDSSFLRDPEFNFARAEDKDCGDQAKIDKLAAAYLAKARANGANAVAAQAVTDFFTEIGARIRWVERARLAAEPGHIAALQNLAERAFRRPLTQSERDDIAAFYHLLREKDGLNHEDAIRDTLVSVLMSPHFCFRLDLPVPGGGTTDTHAPSVATAPLSDYALASRLSYFLWSSMPDKELLDRAAAGDLHRPAVIVAQARRMLQDARVRGLAVDFGGSWLDFRRFDEYNSVDRQRFPRFNNELRQAMFEEPIRFLTHLAQKNGSALDLLYANYTFVNPILARHYGMKEISGGADDWTRVDDAGRFGRGGLAAMAVFLTKNSPGLRTSPVKRGYWVVRRLLGEHIPPPPPKVPELPSDEAKLGDITLREALALHRADKNCAACHAHFDAMGLVFEGYGPIGERREKDLGGRVVDARATFPNGSEGSGLEGLRTYLREKRQDDFVDNLCREMLAYGLGRTLLLSDDDTIEAMRVKLAADGYRFDDVVESIVTSPQFLNKRN